ncbi:hypothetical protein [Paenibacillus odorifer]|nr:hypothetical protein [Paenibacillus odorifer]
MKTRKKNSFSRKLFLYACSMLIAASAWGGRAHRKQMRSAPLHC